MPPPSPDPHRYLGLLHCRLLVATPPPQEREQGLGVLQADQCPCTASTGGSSARARQRPLEHHCGPTARSQAPTRCCAHTRRAPHTRGCSHRVCDQGTTGSSGPLCPGSWALLSPAPGVKAARLQAPCPSPGEPAHPHTNAHAHRPPTPRSDLLGATLCPVQEREEQAAAAAVVQGVCVAGQGLARVLGEGTSGQHGATRAC